MISSILLVALFIGVLITFHEFGHLILAKLSRIPVEVFSIGFGPPLLRKKWGQTEYRLAVIPLGGYIKMVGEEDQAAGGLSERSFGVKASVIAAGPVSNLVLGFLMLCVMYAVFGLSYTAPVVDVEPDSPAAAAGFRTSDVVLSAAGDTVENFEDLERILAANAGTEIPVAVIRDGRRVEWTYQVPVGYSGSDPPPVIGRVLPGSPAQAAGLRPGDTVRSIAGQRIATWTELIQGIGSQDSSRFAIGWSRGGVEFADSLSVAARDDPVAGFRAGEIGIELDVSWQVSPLILPVVGKVRRGGPASLAGIRPGDTILSVADQELRSWNDYLRAMRVRGGEKVAVSWRRDGVTIDDSITPVVESDQLTGEKVGQIGITVGMPRDRMPLHRAAWQALTRTGYVVVQTFVIIYSVVARRITARAIGGPIMVAKIAYEGASWGAEYFLALWALLSINLFVVNMLPIPVLDGGRIVLFAVEGIRRRRLSEKEVGWAMNIGWVLIALIVVFTLFNDIIRLVAK
ncbi:MAG: RIP metalloprotease RseP [candidate division WOR-3 bacterium]|nr:MAG: RIP metalloprotease RseP [candidate division WOR-3 bacterium]